MSGGIVQKFYFYDGKTELSRSPSKPINPSTTLTPLRGINPREYTNGALHDYLDYLTNYFDEPKYIAMFSMLRDNDIGVDLIRDALENPREKESMIKTLIDDLGLTSGMARRIIGMFTAWRDSCRLSTTISDDEAIQ
jgi:hypothetical protein